MKIKMKQKVATIVYVKSNVPQWLLNLDCSLHLDNAPTVVVCADDVGGCEWRCPRPRGVKLLIESGTVVYIKRGVIYLKKIYIL